MKILILGAKGMLGGALMKTFHDFRPIGWGMMDMDIRDSDRLKEKIPKVHPDVIINAAAYTDVDKAESAHDLAGQINGHAVSVIASISEHIGSLFVHFSTDYVFDGSKKDGYAEDETTNPLNVYGKSKELGEKKLLESTKNFLLIRTSWLFGHGGKNFVDSILTKASEMHTLKVVDDQFGCPTFAKDLSVKIRELIESNVPKGIYHITNSTRHGGISWYEFAKTIAEIKKIDVDVKRCLSSDYPQKAQRPKFSFLKNTKTTPLRDYREALREYLLT